MSTAECSIFRVEFASLITAAGVGNIHSMILAETSVEGGNIITSFMAAFFVVLLHLCLLTSPAFLHDGIA